MKLRLLAGWTVVSADGIAVVVSRSKAVRVGFNREGRVVNCGVVSWVSRRRRRVTVEYKVDI